MFFEDSDDDDNNSYDELRYLYDDELSMAQAASDCSSSNSSLSSIFKNSPRSPTQDEHRQQPRRSLRKSIVHALASPVKKARSTINPAIMLSPSKRSPSKGTKRSLKSPSTSNKSLSGKNWQQKLDLPRNTTRDQAMAVLLCRELEMMDI